MSHERSLVRATTMLSIVISVGVALPSPAASAKKSFIKATVGRTSFQASPPPGRPADALLEGLDGKVLEDYDDITLVEISEKDKDQLKQRGDGADVLVTLHGDFDKVYLNGKILDVREDKNLPPPGETYDPPYHGNENGAFLIQFVGPIKTEWLERVKAEGIVPVQYVQMHAYIVGARESAIKAIEDLPFIQWTLQMHRFLKPSVGDRPEETIELWIELAETSETDDAVAVLREMSIGEVDVAPLSPSERRVQGTFATKELDTILAQPLVFGIAERPAIGLSDERSALGVTDLVPSAGSPAPQAGKYKKWLSDLCPSCTNLQNDGFYLGIADTGLDGGDRVANAANAGEPDSTDLHRDELPKSKVVWGASFEATTFGSNESWNNCLTSTGPCVDSTGSKHDTVGHGTLVAGIAAGDPLPAGGKDADGFFLGLGVAPSAGIVVTKINSRWIGDRSTALLNVTRNARTQVSPHAYWQNFSMNQYYNIFPPDPTSCSRFYDGAYSILSREFDIAVRDADPETPEKEAITITTSSGNIDQQFVPKTRWNPAECSGLDLTMTLPPATAKNVIAIGGGENVRPDPWLCRSSRADDFMNLAINAKHGTGYTTYYKPDLIAVASNVASLRSSDGVFPSYCGAYGNGSPPPLPAGYDSSTGTSFSAPVGLAAAALASRRFSDDPAAAKPALVKAMLIAGAKSMRGGIDRASVRIWKPSDANLLYYPGNRVLPTTPNEHWYEIESVGTAGWGQTTSEPAWPTNGGTVTTNPGTKSITWRDKGLETATLAIGAVPNRQQGFGRIALQDVLSDYPMRAFINETELVSAGGPWSREYVVHDLALPVRVALVWTDAPTIFSGNVPFNTPSLLVNNLDLSVQVKQSGNCVGRYVGNVLSTTTEESIYYPSCTGGTADTTNNVEVVRFFATGPLGNTTFTVKVASAAGGAQDFGLVVWNAYESGATPPPSTPSNLVAAASSATQVVLAWDASAGATFYDVARSAGVSDPFVVIGTPTTNSFSDSGRLPLTTYLYRVRARNATPTGFSDWSYDPATTILFTDPVLTPGVTMAKAIHIAELRQAVSSLRAAAELSAFTWSDDPIVAGTTMIRAAHVNELRTALDQGRTALGLGALVHTDGTLAPGASVVKRVHVQELRDGF